MNVPLENRRDGAAAPNLRSGVTISDVLRDASKNNFNVVRLVSALAVILAHSFALSLTTGKQEDPAYHLTGFVHSGAAAVAIFFLVSGMFVAQSFYYEKSPCGFLLKRFFRIWPGLAVCLVITATAVTLASRGLSACHICDKSAFTYVLKNAALNVTFGIFGAFRERPNQAINGSLWTLPLEVRMYAVVFLLGVFGVLRRKVYLLMLLALGLGLLVAKPTLFAGYFGNADIRLVQPAMFFLAGMTIFSARDEIALRSAYLPILLFLAAWVLIPTREFFGDLFIISATLWVGCSAWLARLPKLKGDYSYGVYIYGYPVQQLVVTFFPKISPYALFVTAGSIALLCAVASWHFVEKPAQKFGKRLAELAADAAAWRAPVRGAAALGGILWSGWRGWLAPVSAIALAGCGLAWSNYRTRHLPTAPLPVRIVAFGPTPVEHGRPFNVQPSGWSAIWVATDRPVDPSGFLVLDGQRLRTSVSGKLLTAGVPMPLFASRGSKPLRIEFDTETHRAQSPAVPFVVN